MGPKYRKSFSWIYDTRPLTARTLKSIMDQIRPQLEGARVLDLFAGTGRFGLGALNERAELVTFVEHRAHFIRMIKKKTNMETRASFYCLDVFLFLKKYRGDRYDIIFLDPPFPYWEKPEFTERIFSSVINFLNDFGVLIIKYPKRMTLPKCLLSEASLWQEKVIGEVKLLFVRKCNF